MSAPVPRFDASSARDVFLDAKRAWRAVFLVQGLLVALTAVVGFWPAAWVSAIGTVGGLALAAISFFLRWRADAAYERGEEIRRLTLLADALGTAPDAGDVARILAELDPSPPGRQLSAPGDYYDSDLPPGPRRLAHVLWESAHFTGPTARRAARRSAAVALGGMLLASLLLLAAILSGLTSTALAKLAAGCVAGLTGITFGAFADLARNYHALARTADGVTARCASLLERKRLDLASIVPVLDAYNCALARTAPIPEGVYAALKDSLNRSWNVVRTRFAGPRP